MNDQDFTIPPDIEARYQGRWIAWDTDTQQVLADGETMEDVVAAAAPERRQQHLIWYHPCAGPWHRAGRGIVVNAFPDDVHRRAGTQHRLATS